MYIHSSQSVYIDNIELWNDFFEQLIGQTYVHLYLLVDPNGRKMIDYMETEEDKHTLGEMRKVPSSGSWAKWW